MLHSLMRSNVLQRSAITLVFATSAATLPAEELEQIVDKASHTHDSLGHVIAESTLTVTPRQGTPREYAIEIRLRRNGEQMRSWIGVSEPAALKGMQFVRNRISETDDQLLLYVPATKQVQQVPAAAREKKFLNSDFSLADMQIRPADLVNPQIVEETHDRWIVAARPSTSSMYTWILFTIDKRDYSVLRVSFYQAGNVLVKDLVVRAFTTVADTRLPTRVEMTDLVSGSRTALQVSSYRTNVPDAELPEQTFTAAFMRDHK